MSQWNLVDLTPYEKKLDEIMDKFIEDHPEMDMPMATAALVNIVIVLLEYSPTWFKMQALESINKGEKVKIERNSQA